MTTELRRALERVARRFRGARLRAGLAACWLAWSLVGLGLLMLLARPAAAPIPEAWMLGAFATLAAATGGLVALLAMRSARDPRWVARRIEARHPELGTGLLAAIEEDEATPDGPLGFLQAAVVREALEHSRENDWGRTVPTWRLRGARLAHWVAAGLLALVAFRLFDAARARDFGRGRFAAGDGAYGLRVEPGDAEIERGSSLLVVARFGGDVPADASLVVEGGGSTGPRRAMTRSLEDPTFAGRLESVESDLTYRVEFAGRSSPGYRVTVFEHPEVLRTDAGLVFPAYTSLEPKTVEDVRHVTAVEGTELTLTLRLNKPVASAGLVDEAGRSVALAPVAGDASLYRATLTLDDPRRLRVELVDREGRPNKSPAEIAVNVTRNRPPVVKMTRPAHDVRVSPVEELALAAQIEDDFGVVRRGVSYTLAGREPEDVVLEGPAGRTVEAAHLIDFESLGVEPDELLTYHVWAEDVGPDGKPRRASGDLFFAEVRPFEEIFRQGEQPPGGASEGEAPQGGNAQQAMQLAELQKEIINATWRLIRRETGREPSEPFAGDVATLVESQRAAIEQAAALRERLDDPASRANLDRAAGFMRDAERKLSEASGARSAAGLEAALSPEQAAYQALLKLRDREFNVVRGNARQQRGGGGAGGPSQRQLQQLELTDDENRYEQQRSARAQQDSMARQEQRETRQVLNRLHELARRQADLNERLKELQSALEAAEDAKRREEIERQLKRLRDQEREILRDADELRERMEREENRDRMADAREQVERGREHVRQASEALEQGRLSQALTEGTRAGRQLEDLREQMRKRSSDRFSEEMTEMRDQARRLDENQQGLTERLDAPGDRPRHSLREDEGRRQVREGLEAQRRELGELIERMRSTVREAEETEPRLAERLFDAARKAEERSIPDALEAAERLAELGVPEEAARASRHAGQGIGELREGVERAAEGVLGDETAALRLAQGELDDLGEQLDREIAQATGEEPPARPPGPDRDGEAGQGGRPDEQARQPDERRGGESAGPGAEPRNRPGERSDEESPQVRPGGGRPGEEQGDQPGDGGGQAQGGEPRGGRGPGSLRGSPDGRRPEAAGDDPGGAGRNAGIDRLLDGINRGGPGGPITGEGFREWSDRMRDVEELLEDPDLRAEAARIRDRVRGAREDFRRHAKEPDWDQLKTLVAEPIRELRQRVAEEVRRRESPGSLVPIDRDPVPPQFAEGVRRYYERLGSGR